MGLLTEWIRLLHNADSVGGWTILSGLHGASEMKKQKITVVLLCLVFFTCARGAIAATDEEQAALISIEWKAPEGYLPGYYKPGDKILDSSSPSDAYLDYGNLGTEPLNSGVGVPEPGTLVLLITGGLGLVLLVWRRRS
ncbi:MAG: PEP-CTERM sorting domain-containing protein [Planctomycetota bacterium]|jgi:hypothetical protein